MPALQQVGKWVLPTRVGRPWLILENRRGIYKNFIHAEVTIAGANALSTFQFIMDDPTGAIEERWTVLQKPQAACWIKARLGVKTKFLLYGLAEIAHPIVSGAEGHIFRIDGRSWGTWCDYRKKSTTVNYATRTIESIITSASDGLSKEVTELDWNVDTTGKTLTAYTMKAGRPVWDALTELAGLASTISDTFAVNDYYEGEGRPMIRFQKVTKLLSPIPINSYRVLKIENTLDGRQVVNRAVVQHSAGDVTRDDTASQASYGIIPKYYPGVWRSSSEATETGDAILRAFAQPVRFFLIEIDPDLRHHPGYFVRINTRVLRTTALIAQVQHVITGEDQFTRLVCVE